MPEFPRALFYRRGGRHPRWYDGPGPEDTVEDMMQWLEEEIDENERCMRLETCTSCMTDMGSRCAWCADHDGPGGARNVSSFINSKRALKGRACRCRVPAERRWLVREPPDARATCSAVRSERFGMSDMCCKSLLRHRLVHGSDSVPAPSPAPACGIGAARSVPASTPPWAGSLVVAAAACCATAWSIPSDPLPELQPAVPWASRPNPARAPGADHCPVTCKAHEARRNPVTESSADACGLGGAVGRQKLAGVGGRRPLQQDGVERRWRCRFQSPLGRVRSSRPFSNGAGDGTIDEAALGSGLRRPNCPSAVLRRRPSLRPRHCSHGEEQEPHQPQPELQGAPERHQEARARQVDLHQGGAQPGSAISANCADSCSTFHHLGLLLLRLPPAFLPFFAPLLPPRCDHLGLILLTP